MSARERTKGRRGEREVELLALEAGLDVDRNLAGRVQRYGDVALPGVALEVRRRNRVSICEWSRTHEELTPSHLIPAVAYRPDNEPWRVSLPLADFCELLRERGA